VPKLRRKHSPANPVSRSAKPQSAPTTPKGDGTIKLPLTPPAKAIIARWRLITPIAMLVFIPLLLLIALFIGVLSGGLIGLGVMAVACLATDFACLYLWIRRDPSKLDQMVRAAWIAWVIVFVTLLTLQLSGMGDRPFGGNIFSFMLFVACGSFGVLLIPLFLMREPLASSADIRGGVIHRTRGSVTRCDTMADDVCVYWIGDDVAITTGENSALDKALRNLVWAEVDHTVSRNIVFEVRDGAGRSLYVKGGYRPPGCESSRVDEH
jgi:hypothetical protein